MITNESKHEIIRQLHLAHNALDFAATEAWGDDKKLGGDGNERVLSGRIDDVKEEVSKLIVSLRKVQTYTD